MLGVGVYDALSAMLAERAGYDVLFLSGFAVSATLIGEPDFGLLTQTEILETARRLLRTVQTPVIVDGDTGYGGPLNVQRLVRELMELGAGGVLLEDQVWPKRCGHMRGKEVISCEEHVQKLRAAAEARGAREFRLIGRTDARATHGLDEAVRRGRAYKKAGADVIFVEALQSVEELERVGREVPGPLIANMVEGGQTPLLPLERLLELGFEWVVYPLTGLLAAARALEHAFRELRGRGESPLGSLMSFDELNGLLDLDARYKQAEKFRMRRDA
ncbi:MAG: isocitrate lyase/PEP mutase family protein [Deltaproteobacteria bacterium]|nr:isocitrate lyase/PEP mutase family protein [Deltaproteobacteria bacterium]